MPGTTRLPFFALGRTVELTDGGNPETGRDDTAAWNESATAAASRGKFRGLSSGRFYDEPTADRRRRACAEKN